MLNEAINYAVAMHSGQMRKATDIPYIVHPLECVAIASRMTSDEEMLAAAALHDTVEDCKKNGASIEEIKEKFGERVAHFVAHESEDKSKTWMERKQATIDLLKNSTKEECILVLADKLSNMRSVEHDYKVHGEELWQRFNMKDKNKIAWYYSSILDAIEDKVSEFEAFAEYKELINRVFGI
ncbi:MAG: HD domain-containing protein [Lachnospiraceae bacterium]|nr:HD domain-containing protein [Lachnospiraceae bacterium]